MDGQTDTPSYRDATAHLKRGSGKRENWFPIFTVMLIRDIHIYVTWKKGWFWPTLLLTNELHISLLWMVCNQAVAISFCNFNIISYEVSILFCFRWIGLKSILPTGETKTNLRRKMTKLATWRKWCRKWVAVVLAAWVSWTFANLLSVASWHVVQVKL